MKRLLFLMIATIMFAIQGWSQGEITIGSGTSTTSYVPMHCNYDYSYSQTIYSSSEIMGGTISQIAYYMTSTSARTEDIVIYAGNTTKTAFVSNTDFEALANLTQVFSGSVTFNQGWNYITFTTPFLYNGTDNLIIAVDKNTDSWSSRSWQSHTASFTSCLYYYQDDTDIDPNAPAASNKDFSSSRPNTRFVITPTDPGFCFAPSNLAYSNVLPNQATITWDANIDVASYLIEYKTSSQEWSDATLIPGISGNTHVITNLNANTQYNIRVTPECTSALSSIISLRTACETITQFPWIEDFENDFNTVAVAPGNKPAPYCWFVIDSLNTSSYYWQRSTSSNNGNGAAYMYGFTSATTTSSSYNNNDWLISPIITLTGNERLNFWSKKSSSSYYPDLLVYAMDVSAGDLDATASNSNFVLIGQIDSTLLSTTYSQFEFNLSTLVGDYRLAFVRKKIANGSVYIDDLKISSIPTCFPPTNLATSNIGTNQVDITWDAANTTDNAWEIILKDVTNNTIDTVQAYSSPHTISSLNPNINYSFYMRTDCGDGTFSDPTLPITFRTNCISETIPYTENFSTSVVIEPTCWTRMSGLLADTSVLTSITSGWTHSTVLDTAMRVNIYGTGVKYWLISPTIDLGMDGSLYQLDFDVVYSDLSTGLGNPTHSDDDIFAVVVSTDNGNTWSKANATIWYASPDSTYSLTTLTPTPTHISLKLQDANLNPYSGNIKIGLYGESTVAVSGADNYLFVDNFAVDLAPSCPAVFNTTTAVDNFSSIRVNFATDNAEPGTGWDIAYAEADPTSFDPNAATIVSVNDATELPYIITGLNAGSTYSVSVRQNCGGEWSPAVSSSIPNIESTVAVPYIQNFEDLTNISEWTLFNPDSNKWFIGSTVPSPDGTGNTLYVGKTSTTNEYAHSAGYSYAHTLLDFGNSVEFMLSFDWKSGGESTYDYAKVYLLPLDVPVPATGFPTTGEIVNRINLQSSWQNLNLTLGSEYTNTVRRLLFVWRNDGSTGTQPAISIDNISVLGMACASPSNLSFDTSSITQTSANLSWTENGTATSWVVEYSADGLTWLSETATTNTNFVLSELNHSTTYNVRVKSVCNSTDFSAYSDIISFTTSCGAINVPYVQNFDSYGTGSPKLPICWSRLTNQSTTTLYPYISSTNQGGVGSLYFYADSAKYNIGILPAMDASVPLNTIQLSFYYRKGNTNSYIVVGAMSDPNDITTFDSITTVTATATSTWEFKEVSLASYQGIGNYIAFRNSGNTTMSGYIDGLNVDLIPLCPNTYSLTSVRTSYNKTLLNWNALTYAGQGYEVSYSPVATGFDPNTGTIVSVADNTTMTPFELTGLNPSTTYSIAVRQACGGAWSNIITITTGASPAQVPYTCDFEDINESNSWAISNTTTANKWVVGSAVNSGLIIGNSLYVSNDNGVTNAYSHSSNTIVASRLIEFDGSDAYSLTFNSRVGGELVSSTPYDFFKIYLVDEDTNYVGVNSTSPYYASASYSQGALLIDGNPYFNNPSNPDSINNHSIELPSQGVAGTVKRLIFVWRNDSSSGTQPPVSIDNISITALACPAPVIALDGVTQNDITISWTPSSSDDGWTIFYKAATDTYYDSSTYTTTPPPYTLSGLNSNTEYNIYIKADCGMSSSVESNIINARTLCDAITTLPYTESFDSYGTGSPTYPTCWMRFNNATSVYPYINTTNYSAPGALYFYASSGKYNIAVTPQFDVSIPINSLMATFKMRTTNATSNLIIGAVSDPFDVSTFDSITTVAPSATSEWQDFDVDLSSYTGTGTFIAFKSAYNTATNTVYIDDLMIDLIPTCTRPNRPTASNATSTSIDISWVDPNLNNTAWYIYYRPFGTTDWDSVSTSSSPATVQGLTPATTYEFRIATDCGSISNYTSSITYNTECLPITTLPWNEGFETITAAGEFPACFVTQGDASKLTTGISTQSYNRSARTDSNYAYFVYSCWNRLYTPTFEMVTGATYTFSFWYKADGASGWGELSAGLYTTQGDTTSFVSTIGTPITSGVTNTTYQEYTGTFTVPTTGTYSIGIFCKANFSPWYLVIDDLSLDGIMPCNDPTNIVVTPQQTTATLSWTAGGTETQWEVRLGETGTVETATTNTNYQINNLTANTSYTVYVRANCGGTYSNWVSQTFTTLPEGVTPPTVVTVAANQIAQTTATLNGTITAGSEAITAQGFEWRVANATTWNVVNATGTTISYNLTALTANTAYEFKAFATTASGTVYGDVLTFTTLQVTPPTVVTVAANQIAQTTATLNGTITAGSEAITAQGFEWKAANATTWNVVNATGTTISYNLTALTANTAYEFKAFATTASGTEYGSVLTFTTLPDVLPVVTTDSSSLEGTTVTLYGTIISGTEDLIEYGFEWKEASETSWTSVNGILLEDNTLTYTLIGLTLNTSYEFKAFATTASGSYYGDTKTFNTLGLNDIEGNEISITMYPNPTSNQTNLIVSGITGEAKIILSDMQGRILNTINTKAVNGTIQQSIDASNLAKGIYYVRIQNDTLSRTQKLIVK